MAKQITWRSASFLEMKLYLIRHGQSVANKQRHDVKKMPDPDLTEKGILQAQLTADWLYQHDYYSSLYGATKRQLSPHAIYCSPTRRGLKTAKAIASRFGVIVGIDVWLHEVGGADSEDGLLWGGLPRADALELVEYGRFTRDYPPLGWWFQKVETQKDAMRRASAWLNELKVKHGKDDVVIAIGHGALFDCLAAVAFEQLNQITWMSMHNAAVARMDLDNDIWKLVFWNQSEHLREVLSY